MNGATIMAWAVLITWGLCLLTGGPLLYLDERRSRKRRSR